MRTKLLLLLAACFFMVLRSNAQFDTGRYLLGGSFNIYNTKDVFSVPGSKTNSLNANIQFGKFIKENTVAGVIISYGYLNYVNPNNYVDTSKNHNYSVGIFYRKYKKLLKNLTFFGEVKATYNHSDGADHYTAQVSKSTTNGGSVSFVPGISYAICKRMQVELLMPDIITLSYSRKRTNYTGAATPAPASQKGNIFSFNSSLNSNLLSSFGIGFKFLLGKSI